MQKTSKEAAWYRYGKKWTSSYALCSSGALSTFPMQIPTWHFLLFSLNSRCTAWENTWSHSHGSSHVVLPEVTFMPLELASASHAIAQVEFWQQWPNWSCKISPFLPLLSLYFVQFLPFPPNSVRVESCPAPDQPAPRVVSRSFQECFAVSSQLSHLPQLSCLCSPAWLWLLNPPSI